MANGYTCCIDVDRLNTSIETLSSIEGCLETRDLSGIFLEIESVIKDINFEHNNCLNDYKDSMDSIFSLLDSVERKVLELEESLTKTIRDYSTDSLGKEDLKSIMKLYSPKKEVVLPSGEIQISQSVDTYRENIDDTIQNYMINNNLTDYPDNYHSLEEWAEELEKKYPQLDELEKMNKVNQDMAIWRQERTGASVTSLASSNFAKEQNNINLIREEYQTKYGVTREEATRLATIQNQYEESATESFIKVEETKKRLGEIGNKVLRELNNYGNNETQTTVIPTPETPTETSNDINTVPIGIGIGAAGIAGSIAAVVASEQKSKKNFKLEDYKEPISNEEDNYQPIEHHNNTEFMLDDYDPVPYQAERDREVLNKFYGESYLFEEESDDDK